MSKAREFLEEWSRNHQTTGMMFHGQPVESLDKDDLVILAAWLLDKLGNVERRLAQDNSHEPT